jgi:hypothetical protein
MKQQQKPVRMPLGKVRHAERPKKTTQPLRAESDKSSKRTSLGPLAAMDSPGRQLQCGNWQPSDNIARWGVDRAPAENLLHRLGSNIGFWPICHSLKLLTATQAPIPDE